jgi:hypothetical protein
VENGCEARFVVDDSVAAEILGLLVSDSLQRVLGLHYRDRVPKAFQVLRQAALVCALMKPSCQFRGVRGWQFRVMVAGGKFYHGSRPQHAIQMLVEQNFRQTLKHRLFEFDQELSRSCNQFGE